jgi:hypothetical protein
VARWLSCAGTNVYVAQLLDSLLLRPNIEIVESGLPEMIWLRWVASVGESSCRPYRICVVTILSLLRSFLISYFHPRLTPLRQTQGKRWAAFYRRFAAGSASDICGGCSRSGSRMAFLAGFAGAVGKLGALGQESRFLAGLAPDSE